MERSRVAAITDEIGKSPAECIEFARKYRLDWLELRGVPGRRIRYDALPEAELKEAAKQFSDNGVGISFLNTGLLKHMLPGTTPVRERHRRPDAAQKSYERRLDDLRRAIAAAHILGVDKLRVFAFFRVEDPVSLLPRVSEIIAEMGEIAASGNVQLLVENEASCNVATCAELAEMMRLAPAKSIGINWDPLNGTRFQEDPLPDGYRKLPKERIGNVQIKGKSILDYPEKLDWAAIIRTMVADGYQGKFGLETHIFGEKQVYYSHESMKEILRVIESS
ncbi:MAG: sugar phosphate isomerase/epimerase [bacterium]|nr:sugar phosphate isomerase/epimerase [bacterium]